MKKFILLCTVLIFSIFASNVFAVCDGMNISNSASLNDFSPQINANDYVVWYGSADISTKLNPAGSGSELFSLDSDDEIFLYNGITVIQLTDNSGGDYDPQINASGYVVWYGYESIAAKLNPEGSGPELDAPSPDSEIYLYNGTATTPITNNIYDDDNPQINAGGNIVWEGDDGSDYEIFLYDGSTTTQITNNTWDDTDPRINTSGDLVWRGYVGSGKIPGRPSEPNWEIFLYDDTTTTQITNNTWDDYEPQINDDGYIVWYGGDFKGKSPSSKTKADGGPNNEIFLYNRITTTQITDDSYYDGDPQINASGHIVWEKWDGSDEEIFLYNGITTTQITNNSYDDDAPQINADGQIVWDGSDDTDDEIFLYDGSTIIQITDNSYDDNDPRINANGSVTWYAYDNANYEIFLTTPKEVCNGEDDDCDGETDEGLGQTMCGTGSCAATVDNCAGGISQICIPGTPGDETCNNVDDDCDGATDEGLTRDTACGLGACASTGAETCNAGSWGNNTCTPGTPGTETCNNIDDDCDGETDESLDATTTCGVGICAGNKGVIVCIDGVMQESTCDPFIGAATEICNDGVDNDCNGETDEVCDPMRSDLTEHIGICFINSTVH